MRISRTYYAPLVAAVAIVGSHPVVGEEAPPLGLATAIEEALQNNPTVRAARETVRQATFGFAAARARPSLEVEVSPFASDSSETSSGLEVQFSQLFEISGKRSARSRGAAAEVKLTEFEVAELELEVTSQAGAAFWSVLAAKERLDKARDNEALATRVRDISQERFEAGDVPRTDVLRAEVEVAKTHQEVLAAETELRNAQVALNTVLGREVQQSVSVAGNLALAAAPKAVDELLAAALSNRPAVKALDAAVEQARAHVDLARAEKRPDLRVGAWRDPFDEVRFGVRVGVVAPLFDWGQLRNQVRQADAGVTRMQRMREAVRQNVTAQVVQAYNNFQRATAQANEFRQQVLQPAEQLVQMFDLGYREGGSPILDVLDAQRTATEARLRMVELLLAQLHAATELRRAVGSEEEL